IFLIDTLRADRLRPYAPESRVRTPGLDRYVQSATLFLEGHAQENWTKPSIATLLSGLLPWEHTATAGESVLPRSVRILPELLEEHAFQTAAFICNGYVSGDFGFRRGWGSYRNYIKEGRRTQARFVADDVLAWLDGRDTERPFFLYVHTIDPHVPYIPPPELLETYDPEPYDGPVDFRRDRELLEKIKSGQLRLGARDRRRLEALYDGEITYHDVHMAAILDGLERRGLAEETLVIITADHGEEFFDHDSVGHGHSLYEELLHVPFVIRMPGLGREGARIPEAVGLVDLAPTILDALGLEIPEAMSGRSLLPLLRHESESGPRLTVAGFMEGWRALIVGRRKLIQRTEERMMLFDLEADPQEREDLAAERPLELRTLRGLLGLALAGSEGASMPAHRAERTQIDAETEAQLRALGYVGSSRR
ncbi:MAG: sulfatase, partial [Myxococcales bacterium]|nr:sulfatase [Myxococcales bacterium]